MLKFPTKPMETENFFTQLHLHATGYMFGEFYLRPAPAAPNLWYVQDGFNCRLTADGIFVGMPSGEREFDNWIKDTSHAFEDAYNLLRNFVDPSKVSLPELA